MVRTPALTRVRRGTELLDQYAVDHPDRWFLGWRFTIDPACLKIRDPGQCILSQAFGDYLDGLTRLGLPWFGESTADHGFTGYDTADCCEVERLWIEEIGSIA